MDRDANYVAVGAFVLLLLAMAAGFVMWYSETGDRQTYQRHEIYFDGSVFGLSQGSSVRYLGVAVGRVARIGLDPRDASRVRVVADIAEGTPIVEDTVARLALQGVTGLLYIDLQPADPSKQRVSVPGTDYPVIPSERSDFDEFLSGLPDAVARASEVLARMNRVLSDDNLAAVNSTLASVREASEGLPAAVTEARQLLAGLSSTAGEVDAITREFHATSREALPRLGEAVQDLRASAANLASLSQRLDRLVADNEPGVTRFAGEGLAEIQALVADLRRTSQVLERLGRELEDDPSRILYQPRERGVELPP
ncbi:MAG: MlaD family protein [Steroidobacteraceae bacterium]